MDYYDSEGKHIRVTFDGGNGIASDYVVTRDGRHVGRVTRHSSGECEAMDNARHLFGTFPTIRAAIDALTAS